MQMPQNEIPRNLLADAQAIAIVPGMLRGAFVFGVQHGNGVLLIRDANGSWQAPRMIRSPAAASATKSACKRPTSFSYSAHSKACRTCYEARSRLASMPPPPPDPSAAKRPPAPISARRPRSCPTRAPAAPLSASRSMARRSRSIRPPKRFTINRPVRSPRRPRTSCKRSTLHGSRAARRRPLPGPAPAPIPAKLLRRLGPPVGCPPAGNHRCRSPAATRCRLTTTLRHPRPELAAVPGAAARSLFAQSVPNPQSMQQALQRYEDVANQPQYAALQNRPEFQQALASP